MNGLLHLLRRQWGPLPPGTGGYFINATSRLHPAFTSLWPVFMSVLREYRPCVSASAGRGLRRFPPPGESWGIPSRGIDTFLFFWYVVS